MGIFSAIGGLFNGIGSAISGAQSAKAIRDTNRTNQNIAQMQINAERENVYQQYLNQLGLMQSQARTDREQTTWNNLNGMLQQMQGLKNAGLSTATLSGGFSPGNVQSVSAPTAPKADMNGAFEGLMSSNASLGATSAQLQNQNIQNAFNSVASGIQLQNMSLQNKKLEKDLDWYDREKGAQVGLTNAQARKASVEVDKIKTMLPLQKAELKQKVKNLALDYKLTGRQVRQLDKTIEQLSATIESIKIDNSFKSQINPKLVQEKTQQIAMLIKENKIKEVEANLSTTFGFTADMQPLTAVLSLVANDKHKPIVDSLNSFFNDLFDFDSSVSSFGSSTGFSPVEFCKNVAKVLFGIK